MVRDEKPIFYGERGACMDKEKVIDNTKKFVMDKLEKEGSGHDWWHVKRVYESSLEISKTEKGADDFVLSLSALLHDIADHKFGYTDEDREKIITDFLLGQGVSAGVIDEIVYIVNNISYKSGKNKHKLESLEGRIVQDADRLDAIGAIGIARAFTYGGYKNRLMYDPNSEDGLDTISHFYDKLLLLKDKMNTKTARKIAEDRHRFMEDFLEEFYREW